MSLVVNASLNEVSYIVNEEEGFIEGCVVLDGLIQRDVVIQLYTFDSTATGMYYNLFELVTDTSLYIPCISAPEDYEAAIFPVIFAPDLLSSRSLCGNISVTFDEIVEDMEEFFVTINSSDCNVQIVQPSTPVFILDNSGEFH